MTDSTLKIQPSKKIQKEELEKTFNNIYKYFSESERVIVSIDSIMKTNNVSIIAINELRYAAHHMAAFIASINFYESDIIYNHEQLEKFYTHCLRSKYDALEEITIEIHNTINEMIDIYQNNNISLYSSFPKLLKFKKELSNTTMFDMVKSGTELNDLYSIDNKFSEFNNIFNKRINDYVEISLVLESATKEINFNFTHKNSTRKREDKSSFPKDTIISPSDGKPINYKDIIHIVNDVKLIRNTLGDIQNKIKSSEDMITDIRNKLDEEEDNDDIIIFRSKKKMLSEQSISHTKKSSFNEVITIVLAMIAIVVTLFSVAYEDEIKELGKKIESYMHKPSQVPEPARENK